MWSRIFVALALLAMTLRALIPQGFMLAGAQDDHLISLQICSGVEHTNAVLNLQTGAIVEDGAEGKSGSKPPKADAPCVFAAIAYLAAPLAPVIFGGLIATVQPATFATVAVAPGLGLAAPPPWSTGPPAFD